MGQHPVATAVFGVAFLLLPGYLYLLLQQPRDAIWYGKVLSMIGGEWIIGACIYRLVFHPLAKYPGPLLAAITDWYVVFWIAEGGRHLELNKQHKKHGKHVRYRPNGLSLITSAASRDLHDVKANTSKADAYGGAKPLFGSEMSTTITDHKAHAFRRRVNVAALTPAIIRDFGPLVSPHVDYYLSLLGEGAGSTADAKAGKAADGGWGKSRNMALSVAYCVADMMGTVTFSRSWETQRHETYRTFIKDSPLGVAGIHVLGHMQSLFFCNLHKILFHQLAVGIAQLTSVSRANALWRMSQKELDTDIWSSLMKATDPQTGKGFTDEELISEAGMFIVAGADTSVTATCATQFYLLHNQRVLDRLTREVREAFPLPAWAHGKRASEVECPIQFASPELQKLKYMYACIDEAMRMSPPISCVLPREIGPGGQVVDGEFFPEGVSLGVNTYSLHHSEEYFPDALTYAPERWLPEEQGKIKAGVKDPSAFTPFGVGRYSCIGKHLAYQEMTYMLARQLWLFDMRLDPSNTTGEGKGTSEEGRGCKGEYQTYDRYVSEQHGPYAQFRYREELRP